MEEEKNDEQIEQLLHDSIRETSQSEESIDWENDPYARAFLGSMTKVGGGLASIFVAVLACGLLYVIYLLGGLIFSGLFSICASGYNKWFGDVDGYELGQNGIVYVSDKNVIMKTHPNKIILRNIDYVNCKEKDTIGIVTHSGTYDLLNLNTVNYITNQKYDYMWRLDDYQCAAIKSDSLYILNYSTGKVLQVNNADGLYMHLSAVCHNSKYDEKLYEISIEEIDKEKVVAYVYTSYNGKKGLMNSEFKKLTQAIYDDIIPYGDDILYCKFYTSDYSFGDEVGVILNINGEIVE